MTTNKIFWFCIVKAIIITFLSVSSFWAFGKTIEVRHFDSIFQQFDTVTIARKDGSACVYERNESTIICKNIVNGKKKGFWMSFPRFSDRGNYIIGQYNNDKLCGQWEVYDTNGLLSFYISNISVLSDDDCLYHNCLDPTDIAYIGLKHDYDDNKLIRTYWVIFSISDNAECWIKEILGSELERN